MKCMKYKNNIIEEIKSEFRADMIDDLREVIEVY